jgi:hypothetical protein
MVFPVSFFALYNPVQMAGHCFTTIAYFRDKWLITKIDVLRNSPFAVTFAATAENYE